jgi:hypothetical protein
LKEDFGNQINVYVVIHSLDACNMKESAFMDVLSELATIGQIKFIITVDNFAAGRIWSSEQLDKLALYCIKADTFTPYTI